MSTRTRLSLYMLAGIFLAYEGFKLIKETLGNRPDNGTAFLVVGVVFLVGGIAFFLKAVRDYISGGYFYPDDPDENPGENPDENSRETDTTDITDTLPDSSAESEEDKTAQKTEKPDGTDEGEV